VKQITSRQIRKYAHMIVAQTKYDTAILSDIFDNIIPGIIYDSMFIGEEWESNTKKYQCRKRHDGILKFNISRDDAKKAKINPYHRQNYNVHIANYYELEERLPPIAMDEIRAQDDGYVMTKILIHSMPGAKHRKQFEIFGFLRVLTKLDPNVLLKIEGRMLAES